MVFGRQSWAMATLTMGTLTVQYRPSTACRLPPHITTTTASTITTTSAPPLRETGPWDPLDRIWATPLLSLVETANDGATTFGITPPRH
ncbi:hypothetical protein NUW58_g520 [Xylaria curta]|uniref:Uncharacterized protein n=1 Tax=Xylaria curta TaxID=42375 RepID=A0ACC1PPX5_9PEZI|nr:hypothetical protein NUW58_g520 [Xylaria curta]